MIISDRLKYSLFFTILGGLVLNIPAKLLCGGFAGAVGMLMKIYISRRTLTILSILAQSFSYPLDVTRRRMQLAMMVPETAKFGYVNYLLTNGSRLGS